MKALIAALALVATAAQAHGPVDVRIGYPVVVQQQRSNNDIGVAIFGGMILGAVIANANQPQQVIVQQPVPVQLPVYTEQYLPPNCRPVYDQFGRFFGCFR
jgi:hypothetical protein